MFASRSVTEHILRGVVGLGALTAAILWSSHLGWTLLLLGIGLVALRGCPMCWTIGLLQSIGGRSTTACIDGSCARRP